MDGAASLHADVTPGAALLRPSSTAGSYQRERSHDLWAEITPLLEVHHREIAHYPDIPLDPDVERYNAAEDAGMLRCYTARVGERLVGYATFFLNNNLHYKSSLQAAQDVIFVLPEYRCGRIGISLIKYCDAALRAEGVQATYQHVKAAHNFGPLLERMGYELVDLIYAKRLDKG